MRIPDLSRPTTSARASDGTAPEAFETDTAIEQSRRQRGIGRPSTLRNLSYGAPINATSDVSQRSEGEEEEKRGLDERASGCPKGKTFFRCANGFTGCCSHDPCNPEGSCRDGESARSETKTSQTMTDAESTSLSVTSDHPSRTHHRTHSHGEHPHRTHTMYTHDKPTESSQINSDTSHLKPTHISSSDVSESSSSSSSSTSSSFSDPSATPPPPCPAGNGTHFTDSNKIDYAIYCNMENTQLTYKTITVDNGGYGQCFFACSETHSCGGFTYIGQDSGTCFLKNEMSNSTYTTKDSNKYVSCAKLDPTAAIDMNKPKKIGIIAGAVTGGLILLALLCFLVAFCAKRHGKKVEERRATITHVISSPIPQQSYEPPGHRREGSTSHDVYGGSYYAPSHTRQRSMYRDQQWV